MKTRNADIFVVFLLIYYLSSEFDFSHSLPHFGSILPGSFWLSRLESFAKGKYQRSSLEAFKSFSCLERKDQRYPDLSSNCSNYYRCLGGLSYSYACGAKKAFDMEHQRCRPRSEVKCVDVPQSSTKCFNQPDGFYPNYEDKCKSYYRCNKKKLVEEKQCNHNSKWDLATKSCSSDKNIFCLTPSCSGLKDGLYPTQKSSCFSYFVCKSNYRIDMACPTGTIFDYMKKKCLPENETICYENACQRKLNGKHAVTEGRCNTFVDCFNGKLRHIEICKPGFIFDGLSCSAKRGFRCVKNIDDSACYSRPDGNYVSERSDCKFFYRCRSRQVIGTFRCDSNMIFNGHRCVKNVNYVCKYAFAIYMCDNKFDGHYTMKNTNCRKFFRCYNFKKVAENICPRKYVFDGISCVDPQTFTCNS